MVDRQIQNLLSRHSQGKPGPNVQQYRSRSPYPYFCNGGKKKAARGKLLEMHRLTTLPVLYRDGDA